MGREIRRVPPNWEHPTQQCPHSPWAGGCDEAKKNGGRCYLPLMEGYAEAKAGFEKMQAEKGLQEALDYYGQAPDANDYVPDWSEAEATWFQVYQTVSEGSPVTPPFPTKEALVEYLMANGDFWDQSRGRGGYTRAQAEAFVMGSGYVPSLMVTDGQVHQGIEIASVK